MKSNWIRGGAAMLAVTVAMVAGGCKDKKVVTQKPVTAPETPLVDTKPYVPGDTGGGFATPTPPTDAGMTGSTPMTMSDPITPTQTTPTVTESSLKIKAPPARSSASPSRGGGTWYTVKKGDTLSEISQKHYGTAKKWKQIVAANPGLKPEKLIVGKRIKLP